MREKTNLLRNASFIIHSYKPNQILSFSSRAFNISIKLAKKVTTMHILITLSPTSITFYQDTSRKILRGQDTVRKIHKKSLKTKQALFNDCKNYEIMLFMQISIESTTRTKFILITLKLSPDHPPFHSLSQPQESFSHVPSKELEGYKSLLLR